jgi:MoaA/NifB/PqqE/SkfB family radical SAM enzyme
MAAGDWERVLAEAAALGTRLVCFIGGEPTLNAALPSLVRHALSLGLQAEVYSNLVRVAPGLWGLFEIPGVRLATSWYTDDRAEHRRITGRDTFRQTLAGIEEATRRGIPLRAGMITGILPGQHAAEGEELLRAHGVRNIGTDHLREFGRGTRPDPSQACGSCGNGKAAVLPDGSVTPCPLTRWMTAGSVLSTPLADSLGTVRDLARTLLTSSADPCVPNCKPTAGDGLDCAPSESPACLPKYCGPEGGDDD